MLPAAGESGTASVVAAASKADDIGVVARPLAPPEVGPLPDGVETGEEEDKGDSEVDGEGEEEEDDDDEALVEAVETLLREVEILRRASSFPGLEALSTIDKAGPYLGPTMESNWVLPGRLLVGAYPASMNDSHHAHLLCTILLQGVSTFVCLQQEYRSEGVTEEMWRSGEALRPYFQDVLQLLGKLRELRRADPRSVPAICEPEDTDFVHFPIVDCNVADDTKVLQLAAQLAARLARGEVMYLHCWGGHGRTGTVVCIMLHLMYGLSAEEAMERCQHVHDVRRIPISVGSPQTEAQREQVRRVIGHVIAHRQSLPPSPPPPTAASAAAGSALTPDSSSRKKLAGGSSSSGSRGSAGAAVGGRRAWVRGRRQAFAPAPNGVGEDVSGWLPDGENVGCDGGAEEEENVGGGTEWQSQQLKGGKGKPEGVVGEDGGCQLAASRTASLGAMSSAAASLEGGNSSAAAERDSSMPRRKSFTEPYSEDDPSRGTRMSRLRRKSAPGKPPADVLAARAAAAVSDAGKEDCCLAAASAAGANGGSLSLSPANGTKSRRHCKTCVVTGGADAAAAVSPGSCTGVERCVTRSSGSRGAGTGHPPARCVTR